MKYLTCLLTFPPASRAGGLDPPTNLVTSEVTHHSFRATWTGPEGPVEQFRIDYMPVVGGITEQVSLQYCTSLTSPSSAHLSKFTAFELKSVSSHSSHTWFRYSTLKIESNPTLLVAYTV